MSAFDPSLALTVPSRLIIGPTQGGLVTGLPLDANGLPTYGGTPVGYVRNGALEREEEQTFLRSEALSLDAGWIRGYSRFALAFILVQYDTTALNRLWAYTTSSGGGYQGANTLREPGVSATLKPGVQSTDTALLFVPDDVTQPAVLVYAPIWTNGPSRQRLERRMDSPLETSVVVVAVTDSQNRVLACDLVENLTV